MYFTASIKACVLYSKHHLLWTKQAQWLPQSVTTQETVFIVTPPTWPACHANVMRQADRPPVLIQPALHDSYLCITRLRPALRTLPSLHEPLKQSRRHEGAAGGLEEHPTQTLGQNHRRAGQLSRVVLYL